jgi:hypothetical protein
MGRDALPQGQGSRTFAGARAVFMFNDAVVGYASGCSGSEEIMYEPVDTLDHLETREHVPTGYRVTFTATIFRTIARGPSTDDSPGSLKEQNIFPKFEQILKLLGCTAAIQDSVSGKIIYLLKECKSATYNFNVTARGVVGQNVTFVAIRAFDESEVSAAA